MASRVPLSVFLVVRNESVHIRQVIASCAGADEVVVVDSGSEDTTREIALLASAQVHVREWRGYSAQKEDAMGLCRNDWVLSLDGDEILAPGSMDCILEAIAGADVCGFRIRRDDLMMGATSAPAKRRALLRVFRRSQAKWDLTRTVHEHVDVPGHHPIVDGAMILHHGLDSVAEHARKLVQYAQLKDTMRAQDRPRRFTRLRLWTAFPLALAKQLLEQRLVLKGTAGLIRAVQLANYAFLCEAITYERETKARAAARRA